MGRPPSVPVEDKLRIVQRELAAENEQLKIALGEAHVQLRVWKKSAEYRLGPS
ncbi:MAG: hypothetical protein U0R64_08755 [Candidatus Nanopelagicales bacterium]